MFNFVYFFGLLNKKRLPAVAMAQDPWGSKDDKDTSKKEQKPDGPPDLDELFSKLMGKRKKGGGSSGDNKEPMMPFQFNKKIVSLALVLLPILWLLSGLYTVNERENAVETFLGKYSATATSGLNWHWPYPLGRVEVVDVQSISTMRIGEFRTQKGSISTQDQRVGQMLTKDENIVEIGAAVQYRIGDARAYLFNAANPVDVLNDVVTSAIREVVGANTVDDILTDRRHEWPQQARNIIVETVAAYGLGIDIVALELQDARVPVEVQDAFEDAVRAREDEERLRLQAEAFANERLPIARGNAAQLVQNAHGYEAQTLAAAEADATRFNDVLVAYQKDKAAMRSRLYLDAMSAVYQDNVKVLIEGDARPILNISDSSTGQSQKSVVILDEEKTENFSNYHETKEKESNTSTQEDVRANLRSRTR